MRIWFDADNGPHVLIMKPLVRAAESWPDFSLCRVADAAAGRPRIHMLAVKPGRKSSITWTKWPRFSISELGRKCLQVPSGLRSNRLTFGLASDV